MGFEMIFILTTKNFSLLFPNDSIVQPEHFMSTIFIDDFFIMLFIVFSLLLVLNQIVNYERNRYRLGLAVWFLMLAFCSAFNSSLFSLLNIDSKSFALCYVISNVMCIVFYTKNLVSNNGFRILLVIGLLVSVVYPFSLPVVIIGSLLLLIPNKTGLRLGFFLWLSAFIASIISNSSLIGTGISTQIALIVQLARLEKPTRRNHDIQTLENVDFQSQYLSQYHISSIESIVELKSFYQTLLKEPDVCLAFFQTNSVRYTNEALLNALINHAKNQCSELCIELVLNVKVGELRGVSDEDLSSLFLNMFNNAIEASLRVCKDPIINIELWIDRNYLHLKVVNKTEDSVLPRMKTTKLDAIRHGYGLRIIEELANKYQGLVDINHKDHYFLIHVALQVGD